MQRNRTPLEELRQLAEDALIDDATGETIPTRATECLGICSPGHVMGIADPSRGVYVFNGMDSPDSVRRLAGLLTATEESEQYVFPDSLRRKLDGQLPPERVRDIPWKESS